MPDDFIPAAESDGSILALGDWVFREAARQICLWREGGRSLVVSVNVSMSQLDVPGFVPRLEALLESSGLAASAFEIEVTESQPLRPRGCAADNLLRLRELGVRLALDDFGRGYAGLHALRWIQADVIKFDRSLVQPVDFDARSARMLAALTEFAHAMGAITVAEGVERPAQLAALSGMGCDQVQGFLMGRPGIPGAFMGG